MKKHYFFLLIAIPFFTSCDLFTTKSGGLSGTQSAMGTVGTTFSGSVIGVTGVTNCQATVTNSSNNITTVNASATITNTKILQILQSYPGDFTVNGSTVTISGLQVKNLTDGIEKVSGMNPGVIVNYGSSLNTTYPIGTTSKVRTVTLVNTTDSYPWGGMYIKTIEVTEPINQYGINNIIYIANHKWGLVGVKINFDDASYVIFPVTCNKNN